MTGGTDGWGSVPAREPGHVDAVADGLEGRRTPATSADGHTDGRVQGRPAPQYGEYAPDGWVNPVLEHERREQERRDRARNEQDRPVPDQRRPEPAGTAGAPARATPAAGRFGASPLDFVLTVGLLVIGCFSVLQALSIGPTASTMRTYLEQQYTELSDPAALSPAVLVRAVVLVVAFVLVVWWSFRRLRARRWTFWVPLVGGVVASVLGMVPVLVVVFQDPALSAYLQRMATGG